MKKIITIIILILCILPLLFYSTKSTSNITTESPYAEAPKIIFEGQEYFIIDLVIMNELPRGYSYAGVLSEKEKEFAYIVGDKFYLPNNVESITDFYVYQKCGTPINEHDIDNTVRQWAYVKWSLKK